MNITDPGILACLNSHDGLQEYCLPPALYASVAHPAQSLKDVRVSYLAEIVPYNKTCDDVTGICTDSTCGVAWHLLPMSDMMKYYDANNLEATLRNPADLSLGIPDLMDFAHRTFPWPLNESTPGDVVDWWVNAATRDTDNVTGFLEKVSQECWFDYCKSGDISVGNRDIVGYGMFISTIILISLSVLFSSFCLEPFSECLRWLWRRNAHQRSTNNRARHGNLRLSLKRTLPNLLAAALTFSASVTISTYVYRWTTHSRFDALVADSLSFLSATAISMIAASYWATQCKPHAEGYVTASVALVLVLNVVLFGTHFSVFYKPGKTIERLCAQRIPSMTPNQRYHRSGDFIYLFCGFVCWLLASVGMALHHPRLQRFRPENGFFFACWVGGETMPCIAGTGALIIYANYYWVMQGIMKDVYGRGFDEAVRTWGFGQYLALATWVPPVLQFVYLYCRSASAPVNGGYKVKSSEEK